MLNYFSVRIQRSSERERDPICSLGTIRLACSLAAHYERHQEQVDDEMRQGSHELESRSPIRLVLDSASEYLSHAVILICDKGTNDSQLFLAALDTLISIVTDPVCQLRMSRLSLGHVLEPSFVV